MQIVDPVTRRVYYVIDSGFLAELERRADLEAIREGIADMQAGSSLPIGQAKTLDRATLLRRIGRQTCKARRSTGDRWPMIHYSLSPNNSPPLFKPVPPFSVP